MGVASVRRCEFRSFSPVVVMVGLAVGAVGYRTLREDPVQRDRLRDAALASAHGCSSFAAKGRSESGASSLRVEERVD